MSSPPDQIQFLGSGTPKGFGFADVLIDVQIESSDYLKLEIETDASSLLYRRLVPQESYGLYLGFDGRQTGLKRPPNPTYEDQFYGDSQNPVATLAKQFRPTIELELIFNRDPRILDLFELPGAHDQGYMGSEPDSNVLTEPEHTVAIIEYNLLRPRFALIRLYWAVVLEAANIEIAAQLKPIPAKGRVMVGKDGSGCPRPAVKAFGRRYTVALSDPNTVIIE